MLSKTATDRTASFDVRTADRDLVEDCVCHLDPSEYSRKTRSKYELMLLEWAEWLNAKELGLLGARARHVADFVVYLTGDGRVRVDARRAPDRRLGWRGDLAASTRKGYFAAIRTFYKRLVVHEVIDRDPTYGLKAPKVKLKRGLVLDGDKVRAILDVSGSPRCRIQAFLFAFTAARLESVANLRWHDVDFDGNQIYFDTAKNDRAYCVSLNPELKLELLRWQREQRREAEHNELLARALSQPDALVLISETGKPVQRSTIAKQLKWRAWRAGVGLHVDPTQVSEENKSVVSPHALRRTFATRLRAEGVKLEEVADLLNHRSVDTTRNHYGFASTPRQRQIVNQISY